MTRREFILKWLMYALMLTPILVAELYLLPWLPIFGTIPTLLPVAAAAVAVLEGPTAGAGFGLFVGVLSDALIPGLPGTMTLALSVLGLVAGLAARYGVHRDLLGCMICSAGILAVIGLVRTIVWLIRGKASVGVLLSVVFPEIFWSLVFAPLIYAMFLWVSRRVPQASLL